MYSMKKIIQDIANNTLLIGIAILLSIINSVGGIVFFVWMFLEKCN